MDRFREPHPPAPFSWNDPIMALRDTSRPPQGLVVGYARHADGSWDIIDVAHGRVTATPSPLVHRIS